MTVNKRIREARKVLQMSQIEFGRAIFISDGYIAEMENEHRIANDRIIHLICLTFGISEKWLKLGEGEMFQRAPAEKLKRMIDLFNELPPEFQDYVVQQIEQLLKVQKLSASSSREGSGPP
jgi:transcriptional regulator with XRE-family HTH domain